MKNIVIAAGYATRLYPLTENFPKPLLKIGDNTILGRLLDDIDRISDIDEHVIVTNHKFAHIFEEWKAGTHYTKPVTIIDDGTTSNDNRLGAVRDLLLAITGCADGIPAGSTVNPSGLPQGQRDLSTPLLVIAADNILEFSFQGFVDYFKEKQTSVIMCHHEPELYRLQRTGVIEVDDNMKVLQMQEKPEHPVSHWAVPPFYIYSDKDLPLICDCLQHGCGYDAPGNLAHYLSTVTTLHAWPMPAPRFDIGSMDSYKEAQQRFG